MWSKAGVQRFANKALVYTQEGIHAVAIGTESAAGMKGIPTAGSQLARVGATILPLLL